MTASSHYISPSMKRWLSFVAWTILYVFILPLFSLVCLGIIHNNTKENQAPEVIKLFSCSTLLRMKFFLLINVKMPTIVGILTFMSRKNSILGLSEPEKC